MITEINVVYAWASAEAYSVDVPTLFAGSGRGEYINWRESRRIYCAA